MNLTPSFSTLRRTVVFVDTEGSLYELTEEEDFGGITSPKAPFEKITFPLPSPDKITTFGCGYDHSLVSFRISGIWTW
jgi:hypothetical protein